MLDRRRAGVLLHVTSLPGRYGNGDFSHDAYRFVDFLADAGFSVWQTLPLGHTLSDGSPYQCLSAHAGNPLLISLDWLVDRGWLDGPLTPDIDTAKWRSARLREAYQNFLARADAASRHDLTEFAMQHAHWLADYALFIALREASDRKPWCDWPKGLRERNPAALQKARTKHAAAIGQYQFEQWLFFTQWLELRRYAAGHGVFMYGDLPIFVAGDSADVWSKRKCFLLDEQGKETVVAGVPPDYFSELGQRWGNPLFNWECMAKDDFRWWHERVQSQLELFDWIRIDHFRGLEAYWEIPAIEANAIRGRWVKAPGQALLDSLHRHFAQLPLIAEDLGIITPEVQALRDRYDIPGMFVLQFAFDGDPHNFYLPHNHRPNGVVYTGTHDNDTTLAWYQGLSLEQQQAVYAYLGNVADPMPLALARCALASCAKMAILPMQDILELGAGARMNTPGTVVNNWNWRFAWPQVSTTAVDCLRRWIRLYGR
ncbi:MAG: 4-alpha-glucanotransferase [Methylococcaceae bacterium]|nr:MAG: 4-alpha-glucanotransferase [Methylococcaceae bacterium]